MTLVSQRERILVVDDEAINLKALKEVLSDDYRLVYAKSAELALQLIEKDPPSLILLDIMMPKMSGFELCKVLKSNPETAQIPIIFITALSHEYDESEGFALGAVDYITKPISPVAVRARVKTHLALVQVEQLQLAHIDLVQRLGVAAGYKDNDTCEHIARMSHYSKTLALAYGMTESQAENLRLAAPMHDIGKIGIPDSILLKPGRLDESEFELMKQHAAIGAKILENSSSPLLQLAHKLALEHHEKWDGSGYPYGLKGEEISIEGRIVSIADVFDALTSTRPYKKAWTIEHAVELLKSESGKHFDPQLVDLFIGQLDAIIEIKNTFTR